MATAKKGLGKGLGALFTEENVEIDEKIDQTKVEIDIRKIEPNPDQPRKDFDKTKLNKLAESIKKYGVIQPILVKEKDGTYIIIAGERRWRAARLAKLDKVPVIITDKDDRTSAEIALIENLQRENLNPIEEAEGYNRLMKEYKITQEKVAEAVGKSRSAIANSLRLLNLCDGIKLMVSDGRISEGHARALMALGDDAKEVELANEIIDKGLSVRAVEERVKKPSTKAKKKKETKTEKNADLKRVEKEIRDIFQAKVHIEDKNGSGRIVIDYYNQDELKDLIDKIYKLKK